MNFYVVFCEILGDICVYEICIRELLYQYNEFVRFYLVIRLGGNNVVVNVVNSYQMYYIYVCMCVFDIGILKSIIYILIYFIV